MEGVKFFGIEGLELDSNKSFNGHYELLDDDKVIGSLKKNGSIESLLGLEIKGGIKELLLCLGIPNPKYSEPLSLYSFNVDKEKNSENKFYGLVNTLGESFSDSEFLITPIIPNIIQSYKLTDTPIISSYKNIDKDTLKYILRKALSFDKNKNTRDVVFSYK